MSGDRGMRVCISSRGASRVSRRNCDGNRIEKKGNQVIELKRGSKPFWASFTWTFSFTYIHVVFMMLKSSCYINIEILEKETLGINNDDEAALKTMIIIMIIIVIIIVLVR